MHNTPHGKILSEEEIGKIKAFVESGLCAEVIARKLNRSAGVVRNYLRDPHNYSKKKRSGRKLALSSKESRLILRKASNSTLSCTKLAAIVGNKVSKSTIWRTLNNSQHLKCQKMKKAPLILQRHKRARIQFAENQLNTNWNYVSNLKFPYFQIKKY